MTDCEEIFVTQPALPILDDFVPYLQQIWDNKWLTNNGQFHRKLEKEMASFLGVSYVSLVSNGTLALILSLQALRIQGEVITTPYSFVATTHSLWWNNIVPVFVDIDYESCNIDVNKIEAAITNRTSAILPVHVYGNPCDVVKIEQIADNYGLKVIYDAAHCFGNRLNGSSLFNYGDLSIVSFHATKPYTTMEGGAIFCQEPRLKKRIDLLKNFGFADETTVVAPGINSKMNEIQAAFGLLQLKDFKRNIAKRRDLAMCYDAKLSQVKGVRTFKICSGVTDFNYAYYPIFINKKEYGRKRDELYEKLQSKGIYPRRYFYPLISQFPTYRGLPSSNPKNLINAERVCKEVLCLPIYPDLSINNVQRVCEIIANFGRGN